MGEIQERKTWSLAGWERDEQGKTETFAERLGKGRLWSETASPLSSVQSERWTPSSVCLKTSAESAWLIHDLLWLGSFW